ncbi:MAG: hypothetical protein AB7F96_19300 [Beijerinckiaceae bacterium]
MAAEWFGAAVRRATRAIGNYATASDPVVRANNVVALLVASNQPFYPIYVRYLAGDDGGASFLTLLSTPFFLAVPWLSRQREWLSLAAVPFTGLINAALATIALGPKAGIEWFLLPCALAAAFAARRAGRFAMALTFSAGAAVFGCAHFSVQDPIAHFDAEALAALYRLDAFSAIGLSVFIVYRFYSSR